MTTILSIDTATTACSVALAVDGEVRQEFVATPREHTRLVLPMVDRLLAEAGIGLGAVDALAFTAGPGSFTGLRIGFGVVQGLAFGADLPVIPVSTLAVLARVAVNRLRPESALVLPALDARMGEIYWGIYRYQRGHLTVVSADAVAAPAAIAPSLPDTIDIGAGDGWTQLAGCFAAVSRVDAALTPDAASAIDIALPLYEANGARSVEEVELSYIRNEVRWKKHTKIRHTTKEAQ